LARPPGRCEQLREGLWFNPERVIHGNPKLRFAPEIALGRLDRDVSKQELNLIQLAASQVAQPSACPAKIVRRQLVDLGPRRRAPHNFPQYFRRHTVAPDPTRLVDSAKYGAVRDCRRGRPFINDCLYPGRHWHGPHVSAVAHEIGYHPMLLALLERSMVSANNSPRRKPQPIRTASIA